MKFKFIVRPPVKQEYKEELLLFKKEFEVEEEFTEREGQKCAKNLAKKAIEEDFDRIIVVGGDGSVNEVVNGIMEATAGIIPPDFALGIIPAGAGNNFAKELGIKNIKEAFSIIRKNKKILADLGKANERYFVNCVSFGFDAQVNQIANDIKGKYPFLPRDLSYLFGAIGKIIIAVPTFEVKIEGEINFEGKITLAAITNSQSYGAIFKINPGALFDDGKLNLCFITPLGKIRAFETLFRATKGTHLNLPEVKTFQFSSPLIISSSENLPFETDGEVFAPEKKYKIEVLSKTLPILMP